MLFTRISIELRTKGPSFDHQIKVPLRYRLGPSSIKLLYKRCQFQWILIESEEGRLTIEKISMIVHTHQHLICMLKQIVQQIIPRHLVVPSHIQAYLDACF